MSEVEQRRMLFSTDPIKPASRFSAFNAATADTFRFLSFSTPQQEAFSADLSLSAIGGLVVFDIKTNALQAETLVHRARREEETLSFQFCLSGRASISGGDDVRLERGDILLAPNACTGRAYYHEDAQVRSLMIPRQRLLAARKMPAPSDTYCRLRSSAAAHLLKGWIENALQETEPASLDMSMHYERIAIDLIALMLGAPRDVQQEITENGLRVARRTAVLKAIRANALNPWISASKVAALLAVSERYIHMLLEETGRTFSEHVLEERLQHACAKLQDPAHAHLKISEVALASGFNDVSYFNRTFRRRFGEKPSHVRSSFA